MSNPVDDSDELRQWRQVFEAVVWGRRILPDPTLCQDVAFVAFTLDHLRFPETANAQDQ